ncbi:DUF4926 domain-containing protein [Spirulina major CS-329]|uniref:DUF4926 domain-containing protein n=1 Tax=Spirulina TaxID=1154 RepID=UPI00232DF51A|nr:MULTISPECIES: DUF4926 domain-containing protein [Spirulina]MDB9496898.1 DUF4926 domain-containing protein [Spirulina subsalsa CS-330]MDB9502132.1 DUF4926 domain-containing protein [Spirulina major CS-329]
MSQPYPLFTQVSLTQDLPEYNLKQGQIGTIVEHYPISDEEDGYSIEGFNVPQVTIEVSASQIIPHNPQAREMAILTKLRQLSPTQQQNLEDYLDFLLQREKTTLP